MKRYNYEPKKIFITSAKTAAGAPAIADFKNELQLVNSCFERTNACKILKKEQIYMKPR